MLSRSKNVVMSKYQYGDVKTNIFGKQSKRIEMFELHISQHRLWVNKQRNSLYAFNKL